MTAVGPAGRLPRYPDQIARLDDVRETPAWRRRQAIRICALDVRHRVSFVASKVALSWSQGVRENFSLVRRGIGTGYAL